MAARIIDGKAVSAAVRERVRVDIAAYAEEAGRTPTLATVIVGDDAASEIYVANKHRACEEVGMNSVHHGLEAATSEAELLELVAALGEDDEVDGILVQLPVPAHIDPDAVVAAIDPDKDVDGLTPINAGLLAQGKIGVSEALELTGGGAPAGLIACTPSGVMELLARSGVELEGAEAVIVGRSTLVGRPLASLLLAANATVTVCHSRTRDLAGTCRRADVLV
ncbi:MAG: bifunctional 5,10-methylene-tetrahydrofolate dehydrogenase/5,10-methylene-tetrahydrofolate cyclohydrolase, partial [Thermoleophilia bacterium]|nr:bifunctional 5,10-methylene-tetrahydrofolate dehydrogenase/5,10-methylene-tetrahydrofolate cyclohydrolase [Thermoleophilia bacterium]